MLDSLANLDTRWGDSEQQDAQEALHCLLQALQMDMAGKEWHLQDRRRSSVSELSETQQVNNIVVMKPDPAVKSLANNNALWGLLGHIWH